jgi:hypothetical protein
MRIVMKPGRYECPATMPIMSPGGIIVGEARCLLPAGHDGGHVIPGGGWLHNPEGFNRLLEQGKT